MARTFSTKDQRDTICKHRTNLGLEPLTETVLYSMSRMRAFQEITALQRLIRNRSIAGHFDPTAEPAPY